MPLRNGLMALLLGAIIAVVMTAGTAWALAKLVRRDPDALPGWVNVICLMVGVGVGLGVWWVTSH
jgi:hypothetical protein